MQRLWQFYHFLLLLWGDASLSPRPVQMSLAVNVNIWEPLNKKTKATIIGITKSKLDHTVPDHKVNPPAYDILWCDRNRNGGGVACYVRIYVLMQDLWIVKKLKILLLTYFCQSRNQLL